VSALSERTRSQLARSGSANIANCLLKRGLRNTMLLGLLPLSPEQPVLVGPAWTVRFIPAREDLDTMALYATEQSLHRRAIEECPPGTVLVLAPGGEMRASVMGDMMALRLKVRGVEGAITDGGYRDAPGIRTTGLPCFQVRNSGPATPIALSPCEFQVPVGVAGVAVYPGDVIVGDAEGALVLPAALAEEVARDALEQEEREAWAIERVDAGESIRGVFPLSDERRAEFDQWRSNR
jgi:regulator of RNase E activity RraA